MILFRGHNVGTEKRTIFLTHSSARKEKSLQRSHIQVTPDKLYTATPIRRFMLKCKDLEVSWAVFSDRYGVWFSNIKHEWYEKDPNKVTTEEFKKLVEEL